MTVTEFVGGGGDYMRVRKETPKSWIYKSFIQTTMHIVLRRNDSYDYMIASIIEGGELMCEPND